MDTNSERRINYVIHCQRSGVPIGNLNYVTCAGAMPYLSHWDEMVALHPIFSLETGRLLAFARSEWNRLAKKVEDEEADKRDSTMLQVAFLAVFHSLGSVDQQAPSLPPLHIVQSQMTRLFALAYWKFYLDSKRFAFPTFKINKLNANDRFENLGHYLDACFEIKSNYDKNINDLVEQEKVNAAEAALKKLRNSWIVPVGNKALYRWIRAHMPARYEADAQGWMSTLFCGNQSTILDFDDDETDLLEQIVCGECPAGTAIMHAVRERIEAIRKIQKDHREAFTVDFETFLTEEQVKQKEQNEEITVMAEPKLEDFASKVLWIRAKATWYLQQRAKGSL